MKGLTIAFDLDGTLVETAPDLVHATNHALAMRGLEPVAAEEIRPFISFGARAMIKKGLAFRGHDVCDGELELLFSRFIAYYAENIAVGSHLFPGLTDALDRLAARGARFAVCTNKQEGLSRRLLEALGITPRFAALAGRDTFPVCKPHPDHLFGAIRLAGGHANHAVMVGDSDVDIATAKAANIPIVAVDFGYTDVPVTDLSPDAVISHYGELEGAIEGLLRARASG